MNSHGDARSAAEREIHEAPAHSLADLALKLRVLALAEFGRPCEVRALLAGTADFDPGPHDLRRFLLGAVRDAERMAREEAAERASRFMYTDDDPVVWEEPDRG